MSTEKLRALNLFNGISDEYFNKIISVGFIKWYDENNYIITENTKTNQFYIIISGYVKIIKGFKEREKILGFLKSGDFIGDMAIISNSVHTASVIAKSRTKILTFLREDFEQLFLDNKMILKNLIVEITKRLNIMDMETLNLAYDSIKSRVWKFLLVITDNGQKEADFRLTHQEIAQIIGTNRETISRILSQLKAEGKVKFTENKRIVLIQQK